MRGYINATSPLFEAGFINVNKTLEYSYPNEAGGTFAGKILDAVDEITESAYLPQNNEAVRKWFLTVFLNRLKRSTLDDLWYKDGYFSVPINVYLIDFVGEMAWGEMWGEEGIPNVKLFGQGDHGDTRFDEYIKDQLPEWARDGHVMFAWGFDTFMDAFSEKYPQYSTFDLADYLSALVAEGRSIDRISVEQAFEQSRSWHAKQLNTDREDVDGRDIRTVMTYPDDMKMVRILTPEGLDRESAKLVHCVGKGGYDADVLNGSVKIFSLRDASNNPMATLEVKNDQILQVKGRANGPVAETVRHHLLQFIASAGLRLVRDHSNVGLTKMPSV